MHSNQEEIIKHLSDAWAARRQGDYDTVHQLITETFDLCGSLDYTFLGRIYHIAAQIESDHDRYAEALSFLNISLAFYKRSGIQSRIAHSLRHIADLNRELGRKKKAKKLYKKSVSLYRKMDASANDLANCLRGYGLIMEATGNKKKAMKIWKEVHDLYDECGIQAGVDEAIDSIERIKRQ